MGGWRFSPPHATTTGNLRHQPPHTHPNRAKTGKPLPPAPKKKAPERRGPSLYRVLSDYVNLEHFDPNKPPIVRTCTLVVDMCI